MRNPAAVAKFLYLSCAWCFCDMGYSTLMNHPIQQTAKKARKKKELGWQLDQGNGTGHMIWEEFLQHLPNPNEWMSAKPRGFRVIAMH